MNILSAPSLTSIVRATATFTNVYSQRKLVATLPNTNGSKTTIIQKWKFYWQDLIKDYLDVLKETVENGKNSPKKSLFLCSLFGFTLLSIKKNPNDLNYRENVIQCSNNVLLVAKPIRNPKADTFLTSVETCYNFGLVRRVNLGVASIMWVDNYGSDLGLFKTSCSYLKPQYASFYSRIIDVGFWGKWWYLDKVMDSYDINDEEWNVVEAKNE